MNGEILEVVMRNDVEIERKKYIDARINKGQ